MAMTGDSVEYHGTTTTDDSDADPEGRGMTVTATRDLAPASAADGLDDNGPNQWRAINAEWVKLRTLRSTAWTLIAAIIGMAGIGLLISAVTNANWSHMPADRLANFDAVGRSLAGVNIAQLAVGVLGVLLVTGEYGTGMIRSTFAAIPARLPVIWAKSAVYAAITLAIMVPSAFIAFLGGQALLGSHGVSPVRPWGGTGRLRCGALPHRDRRAGRSDRVHRAQHRRRHRHVVRAAAGPARPRQPATDQLADQRAALPPEPGRQCGLRPAARSRDTGTMDRLRRALPVDRARPGDRSGAGSQPGRMSLALPRRSRPAQVAANGVARLAGGGAPASSPATSCSPLLALVGELDAAGP